MKPTAYEGQENYVFISYAHKDNDRVMQILRQLEQDGIRFWYDDGIAPGSEWPENIAQHLDSSALVIAFLTPNSVASANCRREVTFALSRQKPLLGIVLEKTEMSMGLELQLSAQQCIFRYNYRREEDFIQKVLSCPDLEPCREHPAVEETPQPEPAPKKPETPPRKPSPKKAPAASGKRPKWLIPGLLTMVLALALTVVLTMGYFRVRVTEDLVVERGTSSLSLRDAQITASTVKQINKLSKLQNLSLDSCENDEQALDALNLESLQSFSAKDMSLDSLACLQNSPELKDLKLENCGVTNQMLGDGNLPVLQTLLLKNNPELTELRGVDVSQLRQLQLENTGIAQISFLADAKKLVAIDCSNTPVTDISPLCNLEHLKSMDFSGCAVSSVTKDFQALSMSELSMKGCGLTDAGGFRNFTVLQKADLGGNQLSDIGWLEKSAKTLKKVNLSFNPLEPEQLSFLAEASAMTELNLDGIAGLELSLVRKMPELKVLSARNCGITDISALAGLEKLQELYLAANQIADISGLPQSMGAKSSCQLDLAYNRISNADSLPRGSYKVLTIHGNPLTITGRTFEELKGILLTLDYHNSLTASAVPAAFNDVLVLDTPQDMQRSLKDILGHSTEFVTPEECQTRLEGDFGISYEGLELKN